MHWMVYAKKPVGGHVLVLKYLSRCTHWKVIANTRLIHTDPHSVIFKWKNDRIEVAKGGYLWKLGEKPSRQMNATGLYARVELVSSGIALSFNQ